VVRAESSAVRNADWKVGKDCKKAVVERLAEGEVMRDLVNRQEQVLICSCAHDVGGEQERP
jgi:hypothetical protein